jgi:diguanylate cyclase (GGDEF)-like protein/PAS domain S-box-containing protein
MSAAENVTKSRAGVKMTTEQPGDEAAAGNELKLDPSGSPVAPAPCSEAVGGDVARDGAATSVLPILLADHPEAVFYAVRADSVVVPMPDSVDVGEHEVLEGSALDLVIPESRGTVIDTWDKAYKTGVASSYVRLKTDPHHRVMLHFLDARAQHGVFLGIITAAEQTDEAVINHSAPARSTRFAQVRKDGLAVLLEVDDAFTELLGWRPEEVVGHRTRDLVHPDDETLAVDNWMDMLASTGPGRRVRLRHRRRDGSWIWLEVTNHNRLEDPDYRCVLAEMVDISEEMATQEALRAREQLLDRLAETLPLGLLQVDSASRVIYTNDRLHSMVGTGRVGTVKEQLSNVFEEDRAAVREAFNAVLTSGVDSDIEVRVRPYGERDKEVRYCSLNLRALTSASGEVSGAIVCLADVTENARAREELRTRATFDAVTRCFNRASTLAELESKLAASAIDEVEALLDPENPPRRPAVIYVDLDNFKEVNDAHGHSAGDEFLQVVAERLRRCVRSEDVVGRIGGDEFLVICPHIAATAEAMMVANRLASSLRNQIALQKVSLPSSASLGVAWPEGPEITPETLVAQADIAMYRSKREGSGQPVLFDNSMGSAEVTDSWQWPALPDEPS